MGPLRLTEWSPDVRQLLLKCMPIFQTEQFSIVVSKEADRHWVAHCLEMDQVSEGTSRKEAVANVIISLAVVIEDYVDGVVEGSFYSPAPKEYWDGIVGADTFEIIVEVAPIQPKACATPKKRSTSSRQVLRGRRLAAAYC